MNLIDFHKKNHTILVLIEGLILTIISIVLSLFAYQINFHSHEEIETISFSLENLNYIVCSMVFFMIVEVILVLIIIFIKDKKGNPIKAKKYVHPLFYSMAVITALEAVIMYFFDGVIIDNTYIYHGIFGFLQIVCQLLFTLDVYIWRSEFGLSKFYGNNDY